MELEDLSSHVGRGAGGTVLSLLANPLCLPIVRAHLDGALRFSELHERIDGAGRASLRGEVARLRSVGALSRHVRPEMPYAVDNELTEAGRDLLMVGASLEAWLDEAPNGPIVLSSRSAKAAIRALIGGWAPAIVGQLAIRPQSLTELSAAIKGISYPSLERRLSAMRTARLVKALPENGPGTPYAVTGWTRRAVAILGAAGRWEHLWLDESVERSGPADVETAFMLVAPILELPTEICGSCQLKVTAGREPNERWLAGVHLEIDDGEVSSRAASSADDSTAWAAGAPEIWLDGMAYGHFDGLRFGGEESELATAVVRSLGVLSAGSGGD